MKFKLRFNCWWLKLFGRKTLVFRNHAFFLKNPREAWQDGSGRYLAGLYSFVAEHGWKEYYENKDKCDSAFSKIDGLDMMIYNIWSILVVKGELFFKKPIYINEEDVVVTMKMKEVVKKEKK